jgi:hypothetical protein
MKAIDRLERLRLLRTLRRAERALWLAAAAMTNSAVLQLISLIGRPT